MSEIIGDGNVLEPIERRDIELRSSDVREGIDFVNTVNSGFDCTVDGIDIVLNGRPEASEGSLDEAGNL